MCLIWSTRVIRGLFKYFYIWFPDKMLTYTNPNCKSTELQHISTLAKAVIMNCNEDLSNFGNGTENVIRLFHRVVCFEFLSCLCDGGILLHTFILFCFFCFFFLMWLVFIHPERAKIYVPKLNWGGLEISVGIWSVLLNIWTTEFETGEKNTTKELSVQCPTAASIWLCSF